MKRTIPSAVFVVTLLALLAAPLAVQASSASPAPEATALADGGGFSTAMWAILAIVAISIVATIVWLVKRPKHTEVD